MGAWGGPAWSLALIVGAGTLRTAATIAGFGIVGPGVRRGDRSRATLLLGGGPSSAALALKKRQPARP